MNQDSISTKTLFALAPLFAVTFLDAADANYFAGIFRAIEVDLGIGLVHLGYMQVASAAATMIFGPFWALVADQGVLSRKMLLVVSSAGWGLTSLAMGLLVSTFWQLLLLRFVNTAFLCSCLPITQYFVSTSVAPEQRGRVFGMVSVSGSMGAIVISQVSVAMSERLLYGWSGWRFGLLLLGGMSLLCSLFISALMKDTSENDGPPCVRHFSPLTAFEDLKSHWKVISFRVLCLQGCCGSFAFQVMTFSTMWFQYCGVSDAQAGFIVAMQFSGGLLGAILGGVLSDFLYRTNPLHGRQYMAQVSIGCAVPVVAFVFRVLPQGPESTAFYTIAMFLFGLSVGTVVPGVNRPLLAQAAPKTQIASMMAWEFSLEQAFGSLWGPALVAWLSSISGYKASNVAVSDMSEAARRHNVQALGFVISTFACIAYSMVFVGYTALHWTFKHDLHLVDNQTAKKHDEQTALIGA